MDKVRYDVDKSGSPFCSFQDVTEFCRLNKLRLIIRSRQIVGKEGAGRDQVNDGFLQLPKEVITLTSANSQVEAFRNQSACLILDSDKKAAPLPSFHSQMRVVRYRKVDEEPTDLAENKPETRNTPSI